MATAYGYCRASTGSQHLTFEVQRSKIEDYYKRVLEPNGVEWGGFFEDKATSGAKPLTDREGGFRLWTAAQTGDHIIWYKLDRAFRSVRDGSNTLQMFKEKGVSIHSMDISLDTSTALGSFVMHLLVLLAELEREWVKTRTKEALGARKAAGLPHSGLIPPGWKKVIKGRKANGHPIFDFAKCQKERALLDKVAARVAAGEALHKISNEFYWKGITRESPYRDNGKKNTWIWKKKKGAAGFGIYEEQWMKYALACRDEGYPFQVIPMKQWDGKSSVMECSPVPTEAVAGEPS